MSDALRDAKDAMRAVGSLPRLRGRVGRGCDSEER